MQGSAHWSREEHWDHSVGGNLDTFIVESTDGRGFEFHDISSLESTVDEEAYRQTIINLAVADLQGLVKLADIDVYGIRLENNSKLSEHSLATYIQDIVDPPHSIYPRSIHQTCPPQLSLDGSRFSRP